MPVLMDGDPTRQVAPRDTPVVEIGLINNMPDTALQSTERQFLELLRVAAGDIPVRLRRYALPDVPRAEAGRQHLAAGYLGIGDLWNSRLDGLIVTGTEPRAPALQDEPYWHSFTQVLEWAQENTASTVWSCLAAHAAVLHLDGIDRRALDEKMFGVFECAVVSGHALLAGVPERTRIPHSRFNELPEQALTSNGYTILSRSREAGVDAFAKERKSLFVFFQGHPEYDDRALLREYRRDIARFLRRERETYPAMPRGYFDRISANVLAAFRAIALQERCETLLEGFPLAFLETRLQPISRSAAGRIYGNWLTFLRARQLRRTFSVRAGRANTQAEVSI